MSGNTEKFSGRVEAYVRYRERYDPEVLLPVLRETCGLTPEWVVADVGAGTGMLSEVFLANGNETIALEPNAEMRAACEELLGQEPKLRIVDATAEETGLAAASVDLVAVGRALHWFDVPRAMEEFRRILKPEGWVVVVVFGSDETGTEANEALYRMLADFSPKEASLDRVKTLYMNVQQFFPGGDFHPWGLTGTVELDWEHLHGLMMSGSMAPVGDPVKLQEFETRLREIFERSAHDGVLTLRTHYWMLAGRFAR